MKEKKQTANRLAKRTTYKAPQIVCYQMETEGIIADSSNENNPPSFSGFNSFDQLTETRDNFWVNK